MSKTSNCKQKHDESVAEYYQRLHVFKENCSIEGTTEPREHQRSMGDPTLQRLSCWAFVIPLASSQQVLH